LQWSKDRMKQARIRFQVATVVGLASLLWYYHVIQIRSDVMGAINCSSRGCHTNLFGFSL